MSWIFGFSGNLDEQKKLSLSSIYPQPLITIDEPRLFIVAGGNKFTCNFSVEKKWIVLGVGINTNSKGFRLLSNIDWETRVTGNNIIEPEGHFAVIKWGNEKINFFSDPIGLRTIYFFRDKTGVYFSSNLDWITSVMSKIEIDFKEFGSRWITYNQLSNTSFIYGVQKLPPASSAEIRSGVIKINTENWFPEIYASDSEKLFDVLRGFLSVEIPADLKMSFGLSGGLDSRFLLSFLLKNRNQKFNIHSFGYNDDPDLQVAKSISDKLALKCFFIQPPGTGTGQFFSKAGDYIASTQLTEPVSSFMKPSVMNDRYFEDKFLIDGALAEFAQRQFLSRLLTKGKSALLTKNYYDIIKHLLVAKPKIFKEEYEEMMFENTVEKLRTVFESFPEPLEIGPENFIDLLIVKYRIPNYFGPEQARIDNILPGFMPFAQRTTISASLGIPAGDRKNSQLFYKAIHDNYPELEDFSLVKDSKVYPYGLTSFTSNAYAILKKTIGKNDSEKSISNFFRTHEKTIKEMITRDEIREYKPYDEESVMRILNDFYSGNSKSINDLNWLLSFEMFRKKLNITVS